MKEIGGVQLTESRGVREAVTVGALVPHELLNTSAQRKAAWASGFSDASPAAHHTGAEWAE